MAIVLVTEVFIYYRQIACYHIGLWGDLFGEASYEGEEAGRGGMEPSSNTIIIIGCIPPIKLLPFCSVRLVNAE